MLSKGRGDAMKSLQRVMLQSKRTKPVSSLKRKICRSTDPSSLESSTDSPRIEVDDQDKNSRSSREFLNANSAPAEVNTELGERRRELEANDVAKLMVGMTSARADAQV